MDGGCFNFSGREGSWVEECHFEALGDDNLIVKGYPAYCINAVDASTFDLVHAAVRFERLQPTVGFYQDLEEDDKWQVQPGDTLTVMDPLGRAIAARPVVVEVEKTDRGVRVCVDRSIRGLRAGVDYEESLTFFSEDCCLSGFVVKNNFFRSAVRFGLLLKSHDGLVEGNHFEGHSEQATAMENNCQEFNGIPYNLLIRNN